MGKKYGEALLQEKYGTMKKAAAFYNNQMLDHLNDVMKWFISQQDMVFISTADGRGNCDSSFRGGQLGFVRVINEKTLIYPEYKGNGVMASMGNIVENPHIGLMFLDFLENQIGLHVNGKASIMENDQLYLLDIPNRMINTIIEEETKAERWIVIEVEEAYIHCAKYIPKFQKVNSEKQKNGDFFNVRKSYN